MAMVGDGAWRALARSFRDSGLIACQAEAERERRVKVVHAEGEKQAAQVTDK